MSEVKQWSAKRYGYDKYAILDDRGTEVGFAHRRRDARLIAAAPDLLEALKALLSEETLSVHVGYDEGSGGGNFAYAEAVRTDGDAFRRVRTAIAKAEGMG